MIKPDKEYLMTLLKEVNELRDTFDYSDIDVSDAEVRYLSTKKYIWLGLTEGIDNQANMKAKRSKFSKKIRSDCQFYNKFYYKDEKLIKVECYVAGHDSLDVWYRTCYKDNRRYTYPCGSYKNVTYIFVTEYRNDKVYEEYMVLDYNQIVFWRYNYPTEGTVESYYISFVPNGSYPVLAEVEDIYNEQTLKAETVRSYYWYEDFNQE